MGQAVYDACRTAIENGRTLYDVQRLRRFATALMRRNYERCPPQIAPALLLIWRAQSQTEQWSKVIAGPGRPSHRTATRR